MSLSNDSTIHAIPASSVQSNLPKSTIAKRNTKQKKGLGAKKLGGLGAQKVTKIDFETLEKNAEAADRTQHRLSESSAQSDDKAYNDKTSTQSRRLAYQDINVKEKQDNAKLSRMNEQKKQQAERLGMGMGRTDDVAHSMSMVTISQDNPKKSRRGKYHDKGETFYDAYSSKPRRYKWDETDSDDDEEDSDNFSHFSKHSFSYSSKKSSSVDKAPETLTITPIGNDRHMGTSMLAAQATTTEPKNNRQRKSGVKAETNIGSVSMDKFAGSKAISSDMLYGSNHAEQYEQQQRIQNLQGRTSISSDDYYGTSTQRNSGSQIPDVGDIKDGVKEGVRSVAGKLSSMASGLASSIQDRYG